MPSRHKLVYYAQLMFNPEVTPSHESELPHAYLVAGGGGSIHTTILLRLLAAQLESQHQPYTVVEGLTGYGDDLSVRYPSLQVEDILEHAESHDRKVLFVAHCIGTIAALRAFESLSADRPAALTAIAPPLPSPYHTTSTPQSQKKRFENDTRMTVIGLTPGALYPSEEASRLAAISPRYFEEIQEAHDVDTQLRLHVEQGRAAIFSAQHDWNTESPATVARWHDDWRQSDRHDFIERARIVEDAAHGLHLSPMSGREITPDINAAFQNAQLAQVIATGNDLVRSL